MPEIDESADRLSLSVCAPHCTFAVLRWDDVRRKDVGYRCRDIVTITRLNCLRWRLRRRHAWLN